MEFFIVAVFPFAFMYWTYEFAGEVGKYKKTKNDNYKYSAFASSLIIAMIYLVYFIIILKLIK